MIEDLGRLPHDTEGIDRLVERCKYGVQTKVCITVDDDKLVTMLSRQLWVHLLYWRLARKWDLPVLSSHTVNFELVGNKSLSKLGTLILHDIAKRNIRDCKPFSRDVYYIIQELARFSIAECDEYARSISAYGYSELYDIPEFREVAEDIVDNADGDPILNQAKLDENRDKMWKILCKNHPQNALYIYSSLGLINPDQMFHTFGQVGYKTDLNNTIHSKIITGNYFDGLKDFEEYAVESLSAKRSVYGNQSNIPTASYYGRTQHLATSSIQTIKWKDCGTHGTIPYEITERNKTTVHWKYIVADDQVILLTPENVDEYVGTVVDMRSPLKCKHTDGVCSICAGVLVSIITEGCNVGIYATSLISEKITQTILKEKHVVTNAVIQYNQSQSVSDNMFMERNHLFIKPNLVGKFNKGSIAIKISKSPKVLNIISGKIGKVKYSSTVFGVIDNVIFTTPNKDIFVEVGDGASEIYFSREFVAYTQRADVVKRIDGDYAIIDLALFDFTEPIFKIVSLAYAMTEFVRDCKRYLSADIMRSSDSSQVLQEFIELLSSNVKNINVAYAEIMIRAMMVNSEWDYRIPSGDADEYRFAGLGKINVARSIGTLIAFQGMKQELFKPLTFVVPKMFNPMDTFMALKSLHSEEK